MMQKGEQKNMQTKITHKERPRKRYQTFLGGIGFAPGAGEKKRE